MRAQNRDASRARELGAIWVAFRVLDGGMAWDAALAEAKEVGLKSPTFEQRAKDYVGQVQMSTEVSR